MKTQVCNPNKFYAPQIKLPRITRSRYWLGSMAFLYLLALSSVFVADIGIALQCCCSVLVFFSGAKTIMLWWRQPIFRLQYHSQALYLSNEGDYSSDEPLQYEVLGWRFWSAFLLVLTLKDPQKGTRILPVVCDSCSSDDFRRLKVLVKML